MDRRTHKAHATNDQAAAIAEAEKLAQDAIDDEVQRIAHHLSATTLADRVSGSSTTPGGRLWSADDPDIEEIAALHRSAASDGLSSMASLPSISPHKHKISSSTSGRNHLGSTLPTPKPSPYQRANSDRTKDVELRRCLRDLQNEVNDFAAEVSIRLDTLGKPLDTGPPLTFPLLEFLDALDGFKVRLSAVTYSSPPIAALKSSISSDLTSLDGRLKSAKRSWDDDLARIRCLKTPKSGVFFDACMSSHFQMTPPFTDFWISSSLPNRLRECRPYPSSDFLYGRRLSDRFGC